MQREADAVAVLRLLALRGRLVFAVAAGSVRNSFCSVRLTGAVLSDSARRRQGRAVCDRMWAAVLVRGARRALRAGFSTPAGPVVQ